ncbi:MAG TPA: hypothetical protein VGK30_08410 [Candidatus Binatia bacterium]
MLASPTLVIRMVGPLLIALALLLAVSPAHAAPGDLDPSFGNGGVVTLSPSANTIGGYIAVRPDGGVIVVATAEDATSVFLPDRRRVVIEQLRADGSLDPDFADGGIGYYVFAPGQSPDQSFAQAFVRQPDGRLLIAGNSFGAPGPTYGFLRLLADGTPDPDFGMNGVALFDPLDLESIGPIVLEPDGHILLGDGAAIGDRREFVIRRFDSHGVPDPDFGENGMVHLAPAPDVSNQLAGLARLDDGSIVVAGVALPDDNSIISVVARLLSDGRVDETFGDAGAVVLANGRWPIGVALTSDGQVVVGTLDFSVFRLSHDGTFDSAYGDGGYAHAAFGYSSPGFAMTANSMVVDDVGRVLLGGQAPMPGSSYAFALARVTPDGRQDVGFGPFGFVVTPVGSQGGIVQIASQPDGRIVAGGFTYPFGPGGNVLGITRYDGDGATTGGPCIAGAGELLLRHLTVPLGDELVDVSAMIPLAPGTVIDPIGSGLRVWMTGGVATPLLDVGAPPGALSRASGRGWKKQKAAGGWSFTDKTGETSIRSVVVRRVNARTLRVSARVRTYLDVSSAPAPSRVRFAFGDGACGDATFAPDDCASRSDGDRLLCR